MVIFAKSKLVFVVHIRDKELARTELNMARRERHSYFIQS